MSYALTNLLSLAQSEAPKLYRSWEWRLQFPWWALALGTIAAVLAAFYLYRAQQRIASKKVIVTLTTIRVLILLLVLLMLLGPIWRRFYEGKENGTLWVMLDQSESMKQLDPQSTPLEKLRWADGAGLLPPEARTSTLDRHAARLSVLADDLRHMRQQIATAAPAEDEATGKQRVERLAGDLKKWNGLLGGVAEALDKDSAKSDAAVPKAIASVREVSAAMTASIDQVEKKSKLEQVAGDVQWEAHRQKLLTASTDLSKAADKADTALLARNDAAVKDALDKVSKLSRAELAKLVLTEKSKRGSSGFDGLLPTQNVKVLAFGADPQVIIPDRDEPKKAIVETLAKPTAPVTDMAAALRMIADQTGQGEPASVVLVGDGRQNRRDANVGEVAEQARRLAQRGVRVYTIALGSREVSPDAAVENVEAPDWVFKDDTLKLTALLRLDQLGGKTIDVELHRTHLKGGTGETKLIESRQITVPNAPAGAPKQYREVLTFSEKKDDLPEPGLYDYEVRIKDVIGEVVTTNNRQAVRVAVKDDKLTVMMIEDQPRWEYRYLANYLTRDKRVHLQTMLLQPARIEKITPRPPRKPSTEEKEMVDGKLVNAPEEFQLFPETQEEWYRWKVIVLGDIPPERIPRKQQEMIIKAVADRGATLLVMAGPLNLPANWGNNKDQYPLAELFPCEPSQEWTVGNLQMHTRYGYHPQIAPDGHGHLLADLGIDEEANQKLWATLRTEQDLSWYWHSEFTQAKGGAQVIWSIADNEPPAGAGRPATQPAGLAEITALEGAQKRALLVTMNAGAGKVMYLAGDATWRWRQVEGRNLHERFWGQFIRWAVDGDLPAGGQWVRFGTDKPRYVGGESVTVTARLLDKKFAPLKGQKVSVVARALTGAGRAEAEMHEVQDSPGLYRATLNNLPNGQVDISLVNPEVQNLLAEDEKALTKSLTIEMQSNLNLEQRNVNGDRQTLDRIATAGGGAMVDAAYADVLAEHIPELNYDNTKVQQIGLFNDPREPWTKYSHYVFLGLLVSLISAEWIIRKAGGLV